MRNRRISAIVLAVTALAVLGVAAPCSAGDMSGAPGTIIWDPPQRDSGKPVIFTPPPAAVAPVQPDKCPPALPCGAHLVGAVERNGAVEIQVPAWRW